jgi:N4-gp56 family major capsid protein
MAGLQFWGNGDTGSGSSVGGFLTNPRLSEQLRHALVPLMKFRQFVDIKEGFGLGVGAELKYDKISKVNTAGGTLVETNVMPEHNFTIGRGTITLSEWGNAIPYTGKLDAISQFDVQNPIMRVLRDDMSQTLDKAACTQYKLTQRKYVCLTTATGTLQSLSAGNTLASGGAGTGVAKVNPEAFHFKEVIDELKKRNIPKFDGENYVCIASVNAIRGLKDSTEWLDAAKYGDPERLFNGEAGRYYNCRFIEETNCLANTLGSSSGTNALGEAVVFGAENVIEGISVPEEIRAKIPTDYGRSKGLAWYGILGFEKMWKATDTDQDEHIIHISSSK